MRRKNPQAEKPILLIDAGLGNLGSVESVLSILKYEYIKVSAYEDIDDSLFKLVLLPGVGSFSHGMQRLKELSLDILIKELSRKKKPILGICLGMQLLFATGNEASKTPVEGLNLLGGKVIALDPKKDSVPHVGWENTTFNSDLIPKLISYPPIQDYFYYTHSYVVRPTDQSIILATFEHGENNREVAAVFSEHIIGFQFHPEKSHDAGLELLLQTLNNF